MFNRYVAIGDSFTEGMGDELPGGEVRGWADLVALGLQRGRAAGAVGYANLAIRGRKLDGILRDQLPAGIALGPDLLSLNGGGNDILRPRVDIGAVADALVAGMDLAREDGITVILASGANPSGHMPLGGLVRRRGDRLAAAIEGGFPRAHALYVDNWSDAVLEGERYWSRDRIHLGPLGHARVASNVLTALGVETPAEWGVEEVAAAGEGPRARNTAAYYREHVLPWIGRRLSGRSSGDGREAKRPVLAPIPEPEAGAPESGAAG